MVVALPTQYGKADWTNYQDYWREEDAEYMQARTILRYATSAARTIDWASPSPGHTTYNAATDQLEHFTITAPAKWIGVLASQHLTVTPKTSASDSDPVTLGHKSAGGGGLQFFPTVSTENKVAMPAAYLDIGSGKIIAKATGLTIATAAAVAVLTTDATHLVSSVGIKASNVTVTTLTATGASTLVGGTFSGTLTGGGSSSVTATTGTFGGVAMATNSVNAPSGYVSQEGYFFGSATQARIRQRDAASPFTLGTAGFDITDVAVTALGTDLLVNNQVKIYGLHSIDYYNGAPGTLLGHAGPVVYTATAIVASNYPEGTIWVTP